MTEPSVVVERAIRDDEALIGRFFIRTEDYRRHRVVSQTSSRGTRTQQQLLVLLTEMIGYAQPGKRLQILRISTATKLDLLLHNLLLHEEVWSAAAEPIFPGVTSSIRLGTDRSGNHTLYSKLSESSYAIPAAGLLDPGR